MEDSRMRQLLYLGIAAALGAGLLLAQAPRTAEVELKAVQHKAEVEGDLKGAIQDYGAIVAKYKNDRSVVATALVRMADCYQKMGDAEARKLYQHVVKDYADQTEAAAEARARLGGGHHDSILARRIWAGEGVDSEGSLSADGR